MKKGNEKIKKYGIYGGLLLILVAMIAVMANLAFDTPDINGNKTPNPIAISLVKTFPILGDVAKDLLPDSAIAGYLRENDGSNAGETDTDTDKKANNNNGYKLEEIDKEKYKYIDDTTYRGSKKVSLENFTEPFQKSDNYVNNKETLKRMNVDVKTDMFKTAEAFVNDLFTVDYHSLEVSPDTYKRKLLNYYQPGSGLYLPDGTFLKNEYVVDDYVDWIVTNKVQTEGAFKTDNSLIYVDNNITYIRGELDLSTYSCDDEDGLCEFLPNKVNMKDGGKYIFEVGIAYYGDWYKDIVTSPYSIVHYNVVKAE